MTIGEIAAANERAGFYFWSKDTRGFFGDAPSYWRVKTIGSRVFIIKRKASRNAPAGCSGLGQVREFHPDTGSIGNPMTDDEMSAAGF